MRDFSADAVCTSYPSDINERFSDTRAVFDRFSFPVKKAKAPAVGVTHRGMCSYLSDAYMEVQPMIEKPLIAVMS